jgi:hypothetical protein
MSYEVVKPRRIQVPFMKQEMGLGDAIKQVTNAIGIKPCGACEKRAEWLNRRVVIGGRK